MKEQKLLNPLRKLTISDEHIKMTVVCPIPKKRAGKDKL